MQFFTRILIDLQTAIAARAARDRVLNALLVALWGRIARMRMRLERLVALWRAGTLPVPRASRAGQVRTPRSKPRANFPTAPGWLLRKLGYEVAAYGSQLQHLLTTAECAAFLAAVPQAGRVLRPLLRMVMVEPVPEIVRKVALPTPFVVEDVADGIGIVVAPGFRFSGG